MKEKRRGGDNRVGLRRDDASSIVQEKNVRSFHTPAHRRSTVIAITNYEKRLVDFHGDLGFKYSI